MRRRIIIGGQIALLSLVVLLGLWYRDALTERFEPIQRLFPKPGESLSILHASSSSCRELT